MSSFNPEDRYINGPPARWLVVGALAVALALWALPHAFRVARRQRVRQTITEITKGNRWAWGQAKSWERDQLLSREEKADLNDAMLRYYKAGGEFITVKGFDDAFSSDADRRMMDFTGHDVKGLLCGLPIDRRNQCYPATYAWPAASYIDSVRDAYWAEYLQRDTTQGQADQPSTEPQ